LDDFEITCVSRDIDGLISHCGVKGYGVQPIAIINKLIEERVCSFYTYDKEIKKMVYSRPSPTGVTFLTTDPNRSDKHGLNFLPLFDKPLLRQLTESVR
jgi:hypothetical protein